LSALKVAFGNHPVAEQSEDLAGALMPRWASLPSQLLRPPSISRKLWARPNWQNIMATNRLQLDRPFAAYSEPVSLTMRSNSTRGINPSMVCDLDPPRAAIDTGGEQIVQHLLAGLSIDPYVTM